ncbi:hypothetical protein OG304_37135 [Streptomyces sp. NBC_00160]|uniref:hypothetical protein n=1 Tax=Streptomyces sp. NBC_00160 TaxID=2903628 RepID=UPI0022578BE6|nr:hypothetical protein [Streptomyces sp. NBC_00160]MCX5309010.1 hypothetical protein [Streptomyces sp. NBC_00160]
MAQSLGRQYVHSRDGRVRIGTLRSLESKGLITREPATAPPAYDNGPAQDRIRLTAGGATAVSALLAAPPTTPASATPAVPPAPATTAPTRSR